MPTLGAPAPLFGTIGLALLWLARRRRTIDPSAAFPTAALVAYMRAIDTRSKAPRIGTNIGGGPDVLAECFAGALGREFTEDWARAAHMDDVSLLSLAPRTMHYDAQIMRAIDSGCTQLVILASGLDARAWRLPRCAAVTVFEVDVPRCHAVKEAKLRTAPAEQRKLACKRRVVVAADLADAGWTRRLVDTGFDPRKRAFFLAEGLLMYIKPGTAPDFFARVSGLMSKGSEFACCSFFGAAFLNMMSMFKPVLAKYGTQWTFAYDTKETLVDDLSAAGLTFDSLVSNFSAQSKFASKAASSGGKSAGVADPPAAAVDEAAAQEKAQLVMRAVAVDRLKHWPKFALTWLKAGVDDGPTGVEKVCVAMVADVTNQMGMRDASAAQKKRIVDVLLEKGFVRTVMSNFAELGHGQEEAAGEAPMGYVMFKASKK